MKLRLVLAGLFFLNLNIKTSERKFKNVNDFKKYVVAEGLKTAMNYSWLPPIFPALKECQKLNLFSSGKPPFHTVKEVTKIYGKYYAPYTVFLWLGGTLYHTFKN